MKDFKRLVEAVIKRVNTFFNEILKMSKILFYLGIAIIIVAVSLDVGGVIFKINWQQFFASSGVLGGIGILSVLSSFVRALSKRLKTASATLCRYKSFSLATKTSYQFLCNKKGEQISIQPLK